MPALDHRHGGRELAHAKLTRSLRVVGRRSDGYHLLEAEMVSLDLADELEISPVAFGGEDDHGTLEVIEAVVWQGAQARGAPATAEVPGGSANLVAKALSILGQRRAVRLTKRIPVGAGLGGGSSDAAAVLRFFGCLDPEIAVQLGADVPFCVRGGRALVGGVGEQLATLAYEPVTALLCTPAVSVSTAQVYQAFDEIGPGTSEGWNDLEAAALVVEPELRRFRDLFAEVAGEAPSLAGSGSTWFLERAEPAAWRLRDELAEAIAESGSRASLSVVHTVEPAVASS